MDTSPFLQALMQQQEKIISELPANNQLLIKRLRLEALKKAFTMGFPHPRQPTWKYALLQPFKNTAFQLSLHSKNVPYQQLAAHLPLHHDWNMLVFVNGHFSAKLSQKNNYYPEIVLSHLYRVAKTQPALFQQLLEISAKPEHFFSLLNHALSCDGAFITIPDDCHIFSPIFIYHFVVKSQKPIMANVQNHIQVGKNASCTIIEKVFSFNPEVACLNTQTFLKADENSQVHYYRLAQHAPQTYHFNYFLGEQKAHSHIRLVDFAGSSTYYRNQQQFLLLEEGAAIQNLGLMIAHTYQHVDWVSHLSHLAPQCTSQQKIKSLVGTNGHSTFLGNIHVTQDAPRTMANMINHNLLLNATGKADTAPELEILTDDVQCSHGATVGQLDPDALFYLSSRGIDQNAAKVILTHAFVQEILAAIHDELLFQDFNHILQPSLGALFKEGKA